MKNNVTTKLYQLLKKTVKVCYGTVELCGTEHLPEKHGILVGNHTQMNGPIVGELFFPEQCYIWCAGEMMKAKEVPAYAFRDFWSKKPKWTRPMYRVLSYLITPLAVFIFNHARTIPVYRDMRVMATFKETVKKLKQGANIIIFPEKDETNNNILYQFQENFVDVARLYLKKTGEPITFVPMYIAPKLRKVYIGEGIVFDGEADICKERQRISEYLSDTITEMARDLPEHIVVPYRNIPKKYYLTNKQVKEVPHEKTRG